MDKKTAPDGTKIYTPKAKLSPSGQTNIITDPSLTHSEYNISSDENVALAREWVNDIKL